MVNNVNEPDQSSYRSLLDTSQAIQYALDPLSESERLEDDETEYYSSSYTSSPGGQESEKERVQKAIAYLSEQCKANFVIAEAGNLEELQACIKSQINGLQREASTHNTFQPSHLDLVLQKLDNIIELQETFASSNCEKKQQSQSPDTNLRYTDKQASFHRANQSTQYTQPAKFHRATQPTIDERPNLNERGVFLLFVIVLCSFILTTIYLKYYSIKNAENLTLKCEKRVGMDLYNTHKYFENVYTDDSSIGDSVLRGETANKYESKKRYDGTHVTCEGCPEEKNNPDCKMESQIKTLGDGDSNQADDMGTGEVLHYHKQNFVDKDIQVSVSVSVSKDPLHKDVMSDKLHVENEHINIDNEKVDGNSLPETKTDDTRFDSKNDEEILRGDIRSGKEIGDENNQFYFSKLNKDFHETESASKIHTGKKDCSWLVSMFIKDCYYKLNRS